jgi:flagellar biosynthesis/type III secretory pathway chaperone
MSAAQQEQIRILTELHEVLLREYEILRRRDASALENVVADKQSCVARLERSLAEGGSSAQSTAPAQGLRRELLEVAGRAHRQNETNGAVIASSRAYLAQALGVLRGVDASERLYGHDAKLTPETGARKLGEA